MLTFLDHDHVSPFNNHAEQQIRVPVLTHKISQQNHRSQDILMSLFRSAEFQGVNPVEHVLASAEAALAGNSTTANDSADLKKAA